jgi:hypothetical protein
MDNLINFAYTDEDGNDVFDTMELRDFFDFVYLRSPGANIRVNNAYVGCSSSSISNNISIL